MQAVTVHVVKIAAPERMLSKADVDAGLRYRTGWVQFRYSTIHGHGASLI
jgi:hypothetical protein